ncbi:MAG: hypothetical protein IH602_05085 [Bryobacteraceae bacterium]|nr:hypothetical protein [Bryobacteraceae bacterium]
MYLLPHTPSISVSSFREADRLQRLRELVFRGAARGSPQRTPRRHRSSLADDNTPRA